MSARSVPKSLECTVSLRAPDDTAGLSDPSITISTPRPDRSKDCVDPMGCKMDRYLSNPVVLFGHNYRDLPVGTCTSLQSTEHGIVATWKWLTGDPFADRVKNAFDQGVLRAASIGFLPIKYSFDEDRKGYDIAEWELLEFSIVPVPANPDCVRVLKSLGLDDATDQRDPDFAFNVLQKLDAITERLTALEVVRTSTQPGPVALTVTPVEIVDGVIELLEDEPFRLSFEDDVIVLELSEGEDTFEIDDAELRRVIGQMVGDRLGPAIADIAQRATARVALAAGKVL